MRVLLAACVFALCGFRVTEAYVTLSKEICRSQTSLHAQQLPSFLDKLSELPNPFEALKVGEVNPNLKYDNQRNFESSPDGLIRQAKRVVSADLGIQEPSLLDEKFKWIGPVVDEPLGKTDYLAAGRFFDLRSTFPDLDYRAHDFRIDEDDPATIRLTCRLTGTMRGSLRLRGEILQPTGKTMKCPPEAVTMTFDLDTGKVLKMTSGYVLDRLVGNTAGTTGVIAAALVAGKPASDWELYPATTVLKRFLGRPTKQIPESKTFLAPFPETVMIQLAKGILAANVAAEDGSLLAKTFTYSTPTLAPVRKGDFLEKYAASIFDGVDPSFTHFRVDQYDPSVVWVDVRPIAPGYKGAPQAMSFTFDDDGFCTRITSCAVIDPTIGNGGGLAGIEGYKYAKGEASPAVNTRPLPRVLGRVRRRIFGLVTGKDVDDFDVPKASSVSTDSLYPSEKLSSLRERTSAKAVSRPASPVQVAPQSALPSASSKADVARAFQALPSIPLPPIPQSFLKPPAIASEVKQKISTPVNERKVPVVNTSPQRANAQQITNKNKLDNANAAATRRKVDEKKRFESQKVEAKRDAEEKARKRAARLADQAKIVADAAKLNADKLRQQQLADAKVKEAQAAAKLKADKLRLQQLADAKEKEAQAAAKLKADTLRQQRLAAAKEKEAQAEATRLAAERKRQQVLKATQDAQQLAKRATQEKAAKAAEQRKEPNQAAQQKTAEKQQKQTEEAILSKLSQAASQATIGLFGFASSPMNDGDRRLAVKPTAYKLSKTAPSGVPSLSRWKENADGSVTGTITGSKSFRDGEKVTTSAIAKGSVAAGEVVVTGSGSKYFLV